MHYSDLHHSVFHVFCLVFVQIHHFQTVPSRPRSSRRQLCAGELYSQPCFDLFSTMPARSIFLLTQMRRILPCNKMKLDSCHTDVHLFWLSVNTQGYLSGIKKEILLWLLAIKRRKKKSLLEIIKQTDEIIIIRSSNQIVRVWERRSLLVLSLIKIYSLYPS